VKFENLGVYYERPKLHGPKSSKESFGLRADRTIYLCPQTAFKFHPAFDEALRGILHADQSGELVFIEGRVAAWTEALKRRWWRVMPEVMDRIRFLPSLPQPEFLHLLSVADVVLDPYPFCGGNTSYEAFAVGAAVVTYPGEYLRGRLTSAMYKRMGHEELVAASPEEYIRLAIGLGQDPSRNGKLRREVSDAAGILFDNPDDITSWNTVLNRWIGELQ
jgi:predicted O-linked N-acetylglucosamine transferase (SPINDLY family)